MSDARPLPPFLYNGPAEGPLFLFAHGAGLPMDAPFMETIAAGLGEAGIRVVRFEFPYMQRRRRSGRRGGPDRTPILEASWRAVLEHFGAAGAVIGGKSLGGRIASMIADDCGARGLVCLGYPFHPVGKRDNLRVAHLASMQTPTMIVQGDRDPMGSRLDVDGYALSDAISLHWIEDGEHSFMPRKRSGRTPEQNLDEAIGAVRRFITAGDPAPNRPPRHSGPATQAPVIRPRSTAAPAYRQRHADLRQRQQRPDAAGLGSKSD